ncbi:hypothetical protein MNBD_ALPHA06-641 [hydrothermal vent metagenome]|uniref:Uncharacterized protein n=1 Tax=hydrothermal vent metagenome TaxID=652676 RepID=A0A3B0RFL2_9ZZZZ
MFTARTKIFFSALLASIIWGATAMPGALACETCKPKQKNHQIRVPGFSVNGPNVNITSATVNKNKNMTTTGVSSQGFFQQGSLASRNSFFYGGGGGYISDGPVPTVINGLTLEGASQTRTITEQIEVPYNESITASRWVENIYVLQAVCMDDTGTPHPASRPDPNEQVDPSFSGELFRCMAGTWMQVTLGEYNGDHSKGQFNNGSTIVCGKGEALVHQSGGKVSCAPQTPHRNCNERSLLRKYGPGVKVVRISHEEQFTEQVTRTRTETRTREITEQTAGHTVSKTLVLSGGVGGGG